MRTTGKTETKAKLKPKHKQRFCIGGILALALVALALAAASDAAWADTLVTPPGGAPFAAAVNAPVMMRPFRIYVPTHVVSGRTVFGHLERIEVPLPVDAPLLSLSSIPNEPALPISGNPQGGASLR